MKYFNNALKKIKDNMVFVEDKRIAVLVILAIVTLITCGYSIMTYGRTQITSDTAITNIFADAVWKYHSFYPRSWCYANGDVWSLNTTFAIIQVFLHPFIQNSDFSRELTSLIQLVIGLIAYICYFKKCLNNEAWTIAYPLSTIFLFGVDFCILYDGCYGPNLILFPAVLYCLSKIWDSRRLINKYLIALGIMQFLLGISGARSFADYVIPSVCTFFIVIILDYRNDDKQWKKHAIKIVGSIFIIFVCSLGGYLVYKYIGATRNINDTTSMFMIFPDSLTSVYLGAGKTIRYYFMCFGYIPGTKVVSIGGFRNLISIVLVIMLCVVMPILQAKRINEENSEIRILFFFMVFHNTIIFIVSTLFSITNTYHVLPSIYLFIMVSARYIYHYYIQHNTWVCYTTWICLFTVAVAIQCIGTYKITIGYKDKLQEMKYVAEVLEDKGLDRGYATFWNAYSTQLFSKDKIKIQAVNIENTAFSEYRFLTDSNSFDIQNKKTFVMLTEEEMKRANDINALLYGYETPIDNFIIENVSLYSNRDKYFTSNIHVYVYGDDYGKYLINGSDDGLVTPLEMGFNNIGAKTFSEISMYKGGLVYGPYSTLIKGKYRVTYYGDKLADCEVDVMSEKIAGSLINKIVSKDDEKIIVEINVPERTELVQFRIQNPTDSEVKLFKIEVEKMKRGEK